MTLAAYDWISYHAANTPDKRAMYDLASGRDYSYAQMDERVAGVAGMLRGKGIKPGDRVGFLCLNTTDVVELVFGCWRIGAICLALNFRLTPPELAFILKDSEASLVLVDAPFKPVAEATKSLCDVEHWVMTDGVGGESDFETGLAAATPVYDYHPQSLEDQCLLMYSSGTTGSPKGVIITHAMLDFTASSAARLGISGPDDVTLNNMPLFHIGGLNVTALPSLWGGASAVIMRMFHPDETIKAISNPDLGITTIFLVPAAYNAMRASAEIETADFSRMKIALCGAETVPEALIHWWMERGIVIQEGYGMTETAGAGTLLLKSDIPHRIGSAGRPLIHSQIKIVDEAGEDVPRGTPGEIWFKGLSVTPGYWRNPDANKNSFTDGWFMSGDIGIMDKDGYISIEDRVKDMYISGGENVYPAEIEGLLYEMPQIVEVAVIGVSDPKWGEVGCVCAVVKKEETLTLENVLAHLEGRLAKFKQPGYLHIMPVLPRGGTGKVLKFELRKTVPEALGL